MSEDQFTRLFKYMQQEFSAVRSEIAELREENLSNHEVIRQAVDHLISEYDILTAEEAANAEKFNRLSDKIREHDDLLDQHGKSIKKLSKARA